MQTFARWVSTPENRSALVASQRVADCVCSGRRRRESNPLFLHGPPGTGKTHLASALASEVAGHRPDLTSALISARDLAAGQAAPPAHTGEDAGAADKEREVEQAVPSRWDHDLLLVEDVQQLPARVSEALVQLLDDRRAHGRQTVLTSSVAPGRLDLPARLVSRLVCGLVVGLEPFAPPSRLAFLQDRAGRRQLAVGPDVLAWLAEHAGGSGRQLEGAVARLEALVRLTGRLPDLDAVVRHFGAEADACRPTVERIADRVSDYFRVDRRRLRAQGRSRSALVPRQVGMYLARQLTGLSLGQIGAYFGGRDHSTVLHACRKIDQALARDPALSGAVRQLQADLA